MSGEPAHLRLRPAERHAATHGQHASLYSFVFDLYALVLYMFWHAAEYAAEYLAGVN